MTRNLRGLLPLALVVGVGCSRTDIDVGTVETPGHSDAGVGGAMDAASVATTDSATSSGTATEVGLKDTAPVTDVEGKADAQAPTDVGLKDTAPVTDGADKVDANAATDAGMKDVAQVTTSGGTPDAGGATDVGEATRPSCATLAALCGPHGNEDCCASLPVPGGTFYRSYDGVTFTTKTAPATVSDFQLDKYEVTVGRFRQFVEAGMGTRTTPPAAGAGAHPLIPGSGWNSAWNASLSPDTAALKAAMICNYPTWTDTPGDNEDLPINCLDWFTASAFCAWDGGRLATEAEWNYAAAGGGEQRVYPWSNPPSSTTIDESYASYCGGACGHPQPVGSKSPKGDGKWGHSDLAGNVWEWTMDWYVDPYPVPCTDCSRFAAGTEKVVRGGEFNNVESSVLSSYRTRVVPESHFFNTGVRCARSGASRDPVVDDNALDPRCDGVKLPSGDGTSPGQFTAKDDDPIVTDTITGLTWQRDGVGERPGCANGTACTWAEANSYCSGLSLAGATDWRLPSVKELRSIVDFTQGPVALDPIAFPHSSVGYLFWTANPAAESPNNAWSVLLGNGSYSQSRRIDSYNVRCVRGSHCPSGDRYVVLEGGLVRDTITQRVWQRDGAGPRTGCTGADGLTCTWTEARGYCENLVLGGFDDYRLPTAKEMDSLVDFTVAPMGPTIDTTAFPNTPTAPRTDKFWSSTVYEGHAWCTHFYNGDSLGYYLTDYGRVRCVR